MTKAVAKKKASKSTAVQPISPTPLDMLNRAMERGIDADQLDKFINLHERWEATEARKAFVSAMSKFRSEPILIERKKAVSFGNTNYKHATLDQVIAAALPHLSANGLSHRWETKQEGDQISVMCILTHEQGHSERTSLTATPDVSGGKNSIQAIGSTISYLERYTFMAATGLAASDMDDDGRAAAKPTQIVTKAQAKKLEKLLKDSGRDKDTFLEWAGCETPEETPLAKFEEIVPMLQKAIKRAEENPEGGKK